MPFGAVAFPLHESDQEALSRVGDRRCQHHSALGRVQAHQPALDEAKNAGGRELLCDRADLVDRVGWGRRVEFEVGESVALQKQRVVTTDDTHRHAGHQSRVHGSRGERIDQIAARYGVTAEDIRVWNDLADGQLSPGRRLLIWSPSQAPGSDARATPTDARAPTPARGRPEPERTRPEVPKSDAPTAAPPPATEAVSPTTYLVRPGDTLSEIGDRHGVRLSALRDLNDLASDRIYVGQVLRLRAVSYGLPVESGLQAPCAQISPTMKGLPLVDERLMSTAHDLGIAVHVWTIDEPGEMRQLLDLGVDGLMTDRPQVLKDVLVERGQWH